MSTKAAPVLKFEENENIIRVNFLNNLNNFKVFKLWENNLYNIPPKDDRA